MADTYTLKLKRNTKGLDTIQAVYAFVMALGLREVFIGSYDFIIAIVFGTINASKMSFFVALLLLVNVIFLGIRFFSVPRNLRTIIFAAAERRTPIDGHLGLSSAYLSTNWLIVFLHSLFFFLLCMEFKFIMFSVTSSAEWSPSILSGYILGHAFLLIMNGLWIGWLAMHEQSITGVRNTTHGGIIWFRNNLAFSLLAIGPFALLGTCQSSHFSCISALGFRDGTLDALMATSTVIVSGVFNAASYLLSLMGIEPIFHVAFWVLLCFLANSLIDLFTTGDHYIVLEEVEWERKPEPPAATNLLPRT
jgi:hypothetical protein